MMFAKPLEFHCFNYYVCKRKKNYVLQMLFLFKTTLGALEKSNLDV